jgi:hypothetical protein
VTIRKANVVSSWQRILAAGKIAGSGGGAFTPVAGNGKSPQSFSWVVVAKV